MKILVVTSMWPGFAGQPSYSGLFVQEQVDALRAAGHTVDVELLPGGLGLAGLIRSHVGFLRAARRVADRVRTGGYDVVHAQSGSVVLACLRARRSAPLVMTHHGEQIFRSRFGPIPFLRPLDRFSARRADLLVVVSDRLARIYAKAKPVVLACGVDDAFFEPVDRGRARTEFDLDADAPYVLFPANPARTVKNHARFQAVLERVRQRGQEVREVVLYHPEWPRESIPALYHAVDVMLLTSDSEGSPQVVKEAIGAGLPVVSTDVGDVRSRLAGIAPGGVVTGTATEDELVDGLASLVIDALRSGSRSDAGAKALQYANSTVVTELVELYRSVVARRAGSRAELPPQ